MRALLLFNPNATTTDDRVRDVIASALSSAVDLEVAPTKQRGHATHLAAGAVHAGVEAVFVLGGDGTANEVLQALVGTDVLLGIIPGGGANVLARSLGLPNDAVDATAVLLDHLRSGRSRRITIGRAGARYFGFNAGFAFDAAVVRHVEQHPARKRRLGDAAFVWSTARTWFAQKRAPATVIVTTADGASHGPFTISIVANTDPYTYLGRFPMRVHPDAGFDSGLDLIGVGHVGTTGLVRIAATTFRNATHIRRPDVVYWHDLDGFTLSSAIPQPLMVDGDYAGEHQEVIFAAVRKALHVLA